MSDNEKIIEIWRDTEREPNKIYSDGENKDYAGTNDIKMSKNQKLTGWLDKRFEFKVGDKHPFYKPVLIVKAVDKKTGFVKFKGLRGWRHPQHPYLMLAPKTKIKEQFK